MPVPAGAGQRPDVAQLVVGSRPPAVVVPAVVAIAAILTLAEASAMTGQSESLVKVNIHRGLRKLALMIEKE